MLSKEKAYEKKVAFEKEISKQAKAAFLKYQYSNFDMSIDDICKCASRKLSIKALKKLGAAGVSKNEFNMYLVLAASQNDDGLSITNMHMMSSRIGISPNYFMPLLHGLEEKGLIVARRSIDVKKSKDGVYIIDLIDNHFDDKDFITNPYIRLGHGICTMPEFFDLPSISKFIVLAALYQMRDYSARDIEFWIGKSFGLNLKSIINDAMEWSGCCKRTVRWSIQKLIHSNLGNASKGIYYEGGLSIIFHFSKDELIFTHSDKFSYISHMFNCALEEEGIHLSKDASEDDIARIGELFYRNSKSVDEYIRHAMDSYAVSLQNTMTGNVNSKEDWKKNKELASEFESIIAEIKKSPTKFGKAGAEEIISWAKRENKGHIIQDDSVHLSIRYIISKVIRASRLAYSAIKKRRLKSHDFDMISIIEKIMHYDLISKSITANELTKLLFKYSRIHMVEKA